METRTDFRARKHIMIAGSKGFPYQMTPTRRYAEAP
jgi:hypothetical protein